MIRASIRHNDIDGARVNMELRREEDRYGNLRYHWIQIFQGEENPTDLWADTEEKAIEDAFASWPQFPWGFRLDEEKTK